MKFSDDNLSRRMERKSSPLPRLKNWIAESQSLHSNPEALKDFVLPYVGARQAQVVFWLSIFLPYWMTDRLVRQLGEDCRRHQYQGKWHELQLLLENVTNLQEFWNYAEAHISPNVFYGNWLVQAERYLESVDRGLNCFLNPDKRKKPKRLVVRRGYKDKGSLRPPHEHHGEDIIDNRPLVREDRRQFIKHPLVGQGTGEDPPLGENPTQYVPEGGMEI